jgi:hypothetical protein
MKKLANWLDANLSAAEPGMASLRVLLFHEARKVFCVVKRRSGSPFFSPIFFGDAKKIGARAGKAHYITEITNILEHSYLHSLTLVRTERGINTLIFLGAQNSASLAMRATQNRFSLPLRLFYFFRNFFYRHVRSMRN